MLDYLAAIQKLGGSGERVTTSGLAERMHVSPAAVSSMLKRLEETGFVDRSTVDGVTLTEQGRLAALQLIRRHRLLEVYLIKIMGYTWDQVDVEAHKLQHAISSYFEERMDELCNFPTHCPHGDPIPRKDGTMPTESLSSITALQPGQHGILRRVGSTDARVLRYLAQLELMPGCTITLIEKAPFSGPVTLNVACNGQTATNTKILGKELADQLFVLV
ncbi:MAG: metal-dependent transcriptional regulator [Caldilineaceae bacterium]